MQSTFETLPTTEFTFYIAKAISKTKLLFNFEEKQNQMKAIFLIIFFMLMNRFFCTLRKYLII